MNDKLPWAGRLFVSAYNALPIPFVITSAAFFVSIRLLARMTLESVFGWPVDDLIHTDRAASSVPSIFHSTILCPGLIAAFLSHNYNPSEHISKANKRWQTLVSALLQFCTGYMLNDLMFLLYRGMSEDSWIPQLSTGDLMFVGHHIVTATYMTQTRVYQAGHMSAMICMLLGELSNPVHNLYLILEIASELDCCYGPILMKLHEFVPGIFAIIYIVLRAFVGPVFLLHCTWNLLFSKDAKENLPLWVRIFWSTMIWGVVFGSIPEIMACKDLATSFLAGKEQEL